MLEKSSLKSCKRIMKENANTYLPTVNPQFGLTIMELLVTVAIVGILIATAVNSLLSLT